MKTLLSPMVGAAMASFMLSAHADFIDDSHADVTLLNRYLNQQGRDVVNSNAKAHSIRDWGQGFEFKDAEYLVVYLNDMTERRRVQAALQESDARLQGIAARLGLSS